MTINEIINEEINEEINDQLMIINVPPTRGNYSAVCA